MTNTLKITVALSQKLGMISKEYTGTCICDSRHIKNKQTKCSLSMINDVHRSEKGILQ